MIIKLLGKKVQVEFVDRIAIQNNSGLSLASQLKIWIDNDLPVDEQQDVLLHEIIHVLDYMMDTELTETQVHRLATGLLAFFKENPKYYERWIK